MENYCLKPIKMQALKQNTHRQENCQKQCTHNKNIVKSIADPPLNEGGGVVVTLDSVVARWVEGQWKTRGVVGVDEDGLR